MDVGESVWGIELVLGGWWGHWAGASYGVHKHIEACSVHNVLRNGTMKKTNAIMGLMVMGCKTSVIQTEFIAHFDSLVTVPVVLLAKYKCSHICF